jgi:hypothetical protein
MASHSDPLMAAQTAAQTVDHWVAHLALQKARRWEYSTEDLSADHSEPH